MNYEKIILELLGRIQILEEKSIRQEQRLSALEDTADEQEETSGRDCIEKVTRSQARQIAIKEIEERYPDCIASVASRSEGSGIKVSMPHAGRPLIIKFYYSRTYQPVAGTTNRQDVSEHSWHIVRINEVLNSIFDLCMFSMLDSGGKWHFFLFTPDELGEYNDLYRTNGGDELWLYFCVQGERAYELRDDKIDVTDHHNNWERIA